MSKPAPDPECLAKAIQRFLAAKQDMESLTDAQLADAVIERIWGRLSFGSEDGELLDELLSRFEQKSGIKRDEEGKVVEGGDGHGGWKS